MAEDRPDIGLVCMWHACAAPSSRAEQGVDLGTGRGQVTSWGPCTLLYWYNSQVFVDMFDWARVSVASWCRRQGRREATCCSSRCLDAILRCAKPLDALRGAIQTAIGTASDTTRRKLDEMIVDRAIRSARSSSQLHAHALLLDADTWLPWMGLAH